MNRSLTSSEISSFLLRHPFVFLDLIASQGTYIEDDTLGGTVLVFMMADYSMTYTLTPFEGDPGENDPSKIGYIIDEFGKAVATNTQKVAGNLTDAVKIGGVSLIAVAVIASIVLVVLYVPKR